jgi:hypothetical protein
VKLVAVLGHASLDRRGRGDSITGCCRSRGCPANYTDTNPIVDEQRLTVRADRGIPGIKVFERKLIVILYRVAGCSGFDKMELVAALSHAGLDR